MITGEIKDFGSKSYRCLYERGRMILSFNLRISKIKSKPSGFNHFGFEVEDNDELVERFKDNGYRPPLKRPGDRLYAEYRAIDPDGNNFDISVNGYDSLRPDRDGTKTVKAATT